MLGLGFTGIVLTWTNDFEVFFSCIKKRRKVLDPRTVRCYKSLFRKYLDGKELDEELVNHVINHRNGWLRNVFRHYVQCLYYKRKISPELFGWITEIVPSRGYKLNVRPYQVSLDDVRKTMRFLRENHELYYLLSRLMLESGIRLSHAPFLFSFVESPGDSFNSDHRLRGGEAGMLLRERILPLLPRTQGCPETM